MVPGRTDRSISQFDIEEKERKLHSTATAAVSVIWQAERVKYINKLILINQ